MPSSQPQRLRWRWGWLTGVGLGLLLAAVAMWRQWPRPKHGVDPHPSAAADGTTAIPRSVPAGGGEAQAFLSRTAYRGRVLDSEHAPVQAFRIGSVDVTSPDGRFSALLPLRAGLLDFTVTAPPLADAHILRAPTEPDLGDIVLGTPPLVRGVVGEADGGPAADALVVCEGCSGLERSRDGGPLSTRADESGSFALPLTAAHGVQVRLMALKEGRVAWAEAGRSGEPARMTLGSPTRVDGRVLGTSGHGVAGVTVVFSESLLAPLLLVSGAEGRFSGDVPPGLYQVTVRPEAARPSRTWTVQVPTNGPLELGLGVETP